MDTKINDGGPAFPVLEQGGSGALELGNPGMSKRAYIAIKAMQGLLAARHPNHAREDGPEVLAADAFVIADAMLAAEKA